MKAHAVTLLLIGLGISLTPAIVPTPAEAQQAGKVYRIGYLSFDVRTNPSGTEAFRDGLRELGYVEGKNIIIEYRWASPDPGRFSALSAELATLPVDVVVAIGNAAVVATKTVTKTVPIVGVNMLEPVEIGTVKSFARPGGNVTGVSLEESTAQVTKKVELFKELVPAASRMAAVWDPTVPGLGRYWPPFRTAATALGLVVYSVELTRAEDLDRTLATLLKDRPNAIFFWGGSVATLRRDTLCDFALKNRLPTLATFRTFTEAGCLVSYGPRVDNYRRAAYFVDKILNGAKPADLPVEQPTKFDLVINIKTATALGLTIPPSLLLRADQVIA